MEFIADILMIAGAILLSIYCIVLSRRLSKFTDLEKGVGGAIAVLSVQVDDMTKTLTAAQRSAVASANKLEKLTKRAEKTSQKLELLIASLHDLPEAPSSAQTPAPDHSAQGERELTDEERADEEHILFLSQRNRPEAAE